VISARCACLLFRVAGERGRRMVALTGFVPSSTGRVGGWVCACSPVCLCASCALCARVRMCARARACVRACVPDAGDEHHSRVRTLCSGPTARPAVRPPSERPRTLPHAPSPSNLPPSTALATYGASMSRCCAARKSSHGIDAASSPGRGMDRHHGRGVTRRRCAPRSGAGAPQYRSQGIFELASQSSSWRTGP
jgi:hypothetical protein